MRQEHKAGEKMFVDWAGATIPVYDRLTGLPWQSPLFVATLGASSYTWAEATRDQQMESAGDRLMSENRRGRHVVLPVDQLMPLPIVGEEQVVVVGELHAGAGGLHVVAPGHALILVPT